MNIDLNELDFNNIADWPKPIKIACIIILCGLILFLGYWFDISDQLKSLKTLEHQENTLTQEFRIKSHQVANLPAYERQVAEMKVILTKLLEKLPNKREVPSLLEDISRLGTEHGLEFKSFKPLTEKNEEIYTELPIKIAVYGDYHQLAFFISESAILPRIVTMHDFVIHKPKQSVDPRTGTQSEVPNGKLLIEMTAKTYHYTAEEGEDNAKR